MDVPALEIDWSEDMIRALMQALYMGYIRYHERDGVKHCYLTKFGYDQMGAEPPSLSLVRVLLQWLLSRSS